MLFGKFVPDCIRSNLRGSKFKIFLGGGGMPPDPPSSHTLLRVREGAFTRCYHPVSPPPPPQLKILYETIVCIYAYILCNPFFSIAETCLFHEFSQLSLDIHDMFAGNQHRWSLGEGCVCV